MILIGGMLVVVSASSKVAAVETVLMLNIGESVEDRPLELKRDSNLRGWFLGDGISGANVVSGSSGVVDDCPREVKPRPLEKVLVTSVSRSSEKSDEIILVVGLLGRRLRVLGRGSNSCSSVDC